jgi:hypothetical protein
MTVGDVIKDLKKTNHIRRCMLKRFNQFDISNSIPESTIRMQAKIEEAESIIKKLTETRRGDG